MKKLQYIWDYYKLPIAVVLIAAIAVFSIAHRALTKKEPVLYVAAVGVVTGETLTHQLTDGFLSIQSTDGSVTSARTSKKTEVVYYSGLYLTNDTSDPNYRYSYASEIKILASIEAKKLDVVLMNREAYEAFTAQGYLCDLAALLVEKTAESDSSSAAPADSSASDNSAASVRSADSSDFTDFSDCPIFREAGFTEPVYVGVIANSPRMEAAAEYIRYLQS